MIDGEYVSSSRTRKLLREGRVEDARRMLTEPYRIRGMVVHGAGRGMKVGFGTANLDAIDTLLPGLGVYAGRGFLDDRRWPAAIHIGPNPTFGEQAVKVEVHEVDFLACLRGVRQFSGMDDLRQQLARDVEAARSAFQEYELADKLAR